MSSSRRGNLYCIYDESESCEHIGFAWQIDKVQSLMKSGAVRKRGS